MSGLAYLKTLVASIFLSLLVELAMAFTKS